jgi:hypothetical protein
MGGTRALQHLIAGKTCCRILILSLALLAASAQAEPLQVLSQNMNRFFDDVDDGNKEKILSRGRFRQRVETAAEKFADAFELPHIIALQEIENRNVLAQIAAEIERRHGARYRPILIPGHDPSGINLAYLVRYGVEIIKVEQLFGDKTHGAHANPLFSRPPLYLEACYIGNCLVLLNLHLRSMRGINSDDDGDRVRRKRLAQAETIAAWSNRLQSSEPGLSLLILGDLNALTPGDVHVDVAGIDLVEPDLVDLTRLIAPQERYSFIFRRKKQQLDYMLVNRDFAGEVEAIAFSRIEKRFSDHAGLLARFNW